MRHRLYLLKHNKQKLGQLWKLEVELTFLVKLEASLKIFQNVMFFQFSSVAQSCLTHCDPMNRKHQASLSITNSWSPPKPMSIESAMPSNHLILCRPLLLLSSIFPSIRVSSNESALCIMWPKDWSFTFNISPSNIGTPRTELL